MRDGIRPMPVELNIHCDLLQGTIKPRIEYCHFDIFRHFSITAH